MDGEISSNVLMKLRGKEKEERVTRLRLTRGWHCSFGLILDILANLHKVSDYNIHVEIPLKQPVHVVKIQQSHCLLDVLFAELHSL